MGAFAPGATFGSTICPSCTPLLLQVVVGAASSGHPWSGAMLLGAFTLGRFVPIGWGAAFLGSSLQPATRSDRALIQRVVRICLLLGAVWFTKRFMSVGGFPRLFG